MTSKFSPEMRERAVRMALEHGAESALRCAALSSISAKIGCTPETFGLG
jgi:transposase